jgi:hypothetical protein
VNLLEALDDDQLFAPLFAGSSWAPWRAFLKSLFALPLADAELDLYRRHTGRTAAPSAPFTEASVVVGRRGAKSRMLSLLAVFIACFRDHRQFLAPGEKVTIGLIAADRAQARILMRYVDGLLRAVPMLSAMIEEQTSETITLSNRTVIEIRTASFRSTRGYSYAAVLCDEVAFWRGDDDSSANPDSEILRAIRPGLSSIPGSMLVLASSPYRRTGSLWDSYQRHYARDDARVLVWQATTLEMNPTLDPAIIAEAYADDAESAAAEYGAQFRTDLADFITRQIVEACIERGCYERPPARAAGQRYVAFVDAAGGSGSDSMTMAIAAMQGVPTLCAIREVRPPFQPDAVVAEFAKLMKTYSISRAQSDKYAGDWPLQAFAKHNIRLEPSAEPKSNLYLELLPLLNGGRCQLLDHQRLISQLCGLERRTARSGKDSIDHGPAANAHDDVANSCAGALLLVGSHVPMRVNARALAKSRQFGLHHAY